MNTTAQIPPGPVNADWIDLHINEREALAAMIALAHVPREAAVLLVTDSRVVEAALKRGHSSNSTISAAVACIVAQHHRLAVGWVRSADNPADAPSRGTMPAPTFPRDAVPTSTSHLHHLA